jgi:hypothetical protein
MQPPIRDFENMPTNTLEEAVIPLVIYVPNVKHMIYVANENSKTSAHGLTSDQLASIMFYAMEWVPQADAFYRVFNEYLRAADQEKLVTCSLFLAVFIVSYFKLSPLTCLIYRSIKK